MGNGNKKNCSSFLPVSGLDNQVIIKIAAGNHSAALNRKGEVFIWGTGIFGEHLTPIKFSRIDTPISNISIGNFWIYFNFK